MKILLVGAGGMLSRDLWDALNEKHEVFGSDLNKKPGHIPETQWMPFDITDQKDTYGKVSKLNPELIINTAAYSDVDGCEKQPDMAFRINALGTRNLCIACQRFDTTLCHISTDYVFDGRNPPDEGYSENDKTNPINVYGKSKYWAEFYVKHLLNKFYILRVAWLFGIGRNNFVSFVIISVRENKEIKIVRDQWGSPTYTKDIAGAISLLMEKPAYGIYHMTNSGKTSRENQVEEIFKILGKPTKVSLIEPGEVYLAQRPQKSYLKNYFWQLEGFKPIRPWQEATKDFILSYTKAGL
ncbi:MAG: dTDP-4-dehydrorhamnose reductase [Elusimicrobia bacterium RIFOXYB2_FULL_48_7]|nr:MAG: dTDP-4-dehydrorhamnose reductase [Elusimicrobia bacterium RIFOXYB2_FULL_48_7]